MTQILIDKKGPTQPRKPTKSLERQNTPSPVTTKTSVAVEMAKIRLLSSKELVNISRRLLGYSLQNPKLCATFFTWMDKKTKEFGIPESIEIETNKDLVIEQLNLYQVIYFIFNPNIKIMQLLSCNFNLETSDMQQGILVSTNTDKELDKTNSDLVKSFQKLLIKFLFCIRTLDIATSQQAETTDSSIHEKELILNYEKTIVSLATQQIFNLRGYSPLGSPEEAKANLDQAQRQINNLCNMLKNLARQVIPATPPRKLAMIIPKSHVPMLQPTEHLQDEDVLVYLINVYISKEDKFMPLNLNPSQRYQLSGYISDLSLIIDFYIWHNHETFTIHHFFECLHVKREPISSLLVSDLPLALSKNKFSQILSLLGIVINPQYLALCIPHSK